MRDATPAVSRRAVLASMAAAPAAATAVPAAAAPPPKRLMGLPSRQLQFAPSMEEVVELTALAGFDAVEWNVRVGGHVEPATVERDLPRAVELTRKAGLAVEMVCTAIQDARSPHAEAITRTMTGLGIKKHRSSEYFGLDYNFDLVQQIEALKPRFASMAELNEKYGVTTCYHTSTAGGLIGGAVWDMWLAMRDFDPRYIAFNLDFAHTATRNGNGWRPAMMAVRRHIGAIAIKDYTYSREGERVEDALWRRGHLPMGEGMVDLAARLKYLRDTGFDGPVNIHYEHYDLRGIPLKDMTIDMTREQAVRVLADELNYIRDVMRGTGFST